MIRVITFDLWNTLLWDPNYEKVAEYLAADFSRLLSNSGFPVEEARLAEVMGECRAMVMRRQVEEGLDLAPEEQLAWILGRVGVAPSGRLAEELLEHYTTARGGSEVQVMEGARETLATLAREYRLALICNTGRTPGRVIRPWLAAAGLTPYLRVLTFSNELGIAKPNPKIFLHTLEQLGATPETAAHVGDDPRTDLKGARTAGMTPIWFNPRQREDGPDWACQVKQLRELPAVVAELQDWGCRLEEL